MNPPRQVDAAVRRERVVVVCTQYIGDTLLAIPFLRNLRRALPDATIDVLAPGTGRSVLAACPSIDELLAWQRPAGGRRGLVGGLSSLVGQAAWIRSRGYDRAYLLKPSLSAAALVMLAGIPRRVGFTGEAGPLLTRRVRRRPGRHQVETYLDLLRVDGVAIDDARLENWVTPEATRRVDRLLAPLPSGRRRVFLAVRSTDGCKHWPVDRWAEVVRGLVVERHCEVVLCGGPADAAAHADLVEAAGPLAAGHVHDCSAAVPLADVAALMKRMDLCVGVDTGLVHLAASVGVPCTVLVGPTDPNRWAPWRVAAEVLRSAEVRSTMRERLLTAHGRVGSLRWPLGRGEMAGITIRDVLAAVDRLLPDRGLRTLDLTTGSFRYEVISSPGAAPVESPAAVTHASKLSESVTA
ncbi:MAG: glycosyltransferase family 9 protein [Pirellulales bacterium]